MLAANRPSVIPSILQLTMLKQRSTPGVTAITSLAAEHKAIEFRQALHDGVCLSHARAIYDQLAQACADHQYVTTHRLGQLVALREPGKQRDGVFAKPMEPIDGAVGRSLQQRAV